MHTHLTATYNNFHDLERNRKKRVLNEIRIMKCHASKPIDSN